ncbi:MAG TPA: hypothetical protein VMF14_10800 [Solirubrobacteraceae bacterium]|nr:hypothetical protein [Solirubrobacteraceae bacterium]
MPTLALSVRLHRRSLDRDLAGGIAAWRSPAHATRVAQLTSGRHRRRLADALDNVLRVAAAPRSERPVGAVAPYRPSIEATAGQFRCLAHRLRSEEPVAAAGVVRLEALLCDGAGPIYSPGPTDALGEALTMAARWLDVEE